VLTWNERIPSRDGDWPSRPALSLRWPPDWPYLGQAPGSKAVGLYCPTPNAIWNWPGTSVDTEPSDCWIGSGAIVMADVGDRMVVGAGSVVSRPLQDRFVAAGVTAIVKTSWVTTPGSGPSARNLNLDLDPHRSPPDEPPFTHQCVAVSDPV
jgi:hypothetical protein